MLIGHRDPAMSTLLSFAYIRHYCVQALILAKCAPCLDRHTRLTWASGQMLVELSSDIPDVNLTHAALGSMVSTIEGQIVFVWKFCLVSNRDILDGSGHQCCVHNFMPVVDA